jgi:hypothetical protein
LGIHSLRVSCVPEWLAVRVMPGIRMQWIVRMQLPRYGLAFACLFRKKASVFLFLITDN